MNLAQSKKLFEAASALIPGGVNSPVRAFGSVGGQPIFIERGEGALIWDVDGNRYIDFVGSWGPLILGHAHPAIVEAISKCAQDGTSFGAATKREIELATLVTDALPSMDQVRFVNSGTEATMSALRLARGFTGRDRLVKFAGCYHGHGDAFLSDAGSGVATLGIPGSSGVPEGAAKDTITLPYNDIDTLTQAFDTVGDEIAAVIIEPVACNMGLVMPAEGFLQAVRKLCDKHGALFIFDEVITGFRLGLGGAQEHFGIKPDLSTFGKIIGGGLPVGAYGGRRDIMSKIAPLGPVYQAGTLSGNPLAMAAGIATLKELGKPGFYEALQTKADHFTNGLQGILEKNGKPARLSHIASIYHMWLKQGATAAPLNYDDIKSADVASFGPIFNKLLEKGVYIAPSAFEVGFISSAHTQEQLDEALLAIDSALS